MKKIIRYLPSIVWMGVIFYFSSRQTTGIGGNSYWWRFIILKFFHIAEYSVLSILIYYATNHQLSTIFISFLYAVSDEFHQSFIIGRTATIRDIFFDLSGIFFGLLVLSILSKIKLKNFVLLKKNK